MSWKIIWLDLTKSGILCHNILKTNTYREYKMQQDKQLKQNGTLERFKKSRHPHNNTLLIYEALLRALDDIPENELEDYLINLDKIWYSMPQYLKDEHLKRIQSETGQTTNTRTIQGTSVPS